MSMTSSVPYLLRAIHEWIVDNDKTPYLIVDVSVDGTVVPLDYVKDGQIVLNISYNAVRDLELGNEFVMFSARFGGVSQDIVVPIQAVMGVVSRENGEGMWFPRDDADPPSPPAAPDEPPPPPKGGPSLKVVK